MAKETTFEQPTKQHPAILAYDSANDTWRAVYVDDSGNLQVEAAALPLPTGAATETTLAACKTALELLDDLRNALDSVGTDELDVNIEASVALDVQQHQYTGAAWVKSNLLWGYNDRWAEAVGDTNLGAGTQQVVTTAVPSGYVYVVRAITASVASGSITNLYIALYDGSSYYYIDTTTPPASGVWYPVILEVPLKEGDQIIAQVTGATAGDDLYLRVWGYKMKADM